MDCLQITLKTSVLDKLLPKEDEFFIYVPQRAFNAYLSQIVGLNIYQGTARIVGNGYFTDPNNSVNLGKTIQYDQNSSLFINSENGDCWVFINKKYYLNSIGYIGSNDVEFNMSQLSYSNDCIQIGGVTGISMGKKCIAYTQNLPPNIKRLYANGIKGDIKYLTKYPLTNFSCNNEELSGDIETISSLSSLVTLNLTGTNVTGNLNNFINQMAEIRRDGSSLTVYGNNYITYNNSLIPQNGIKITFNSSGIPDVVNL